MLHHLSRRPHHSALRVVRRFRFSVAWVSRKCLDPKAQASESQAVEYNQCWSVALGGNGWKVVTALLGSWQQVPLSPCSGTRSHSCPGLQLSRRDVPSGTLSPLPEWVAWLPLSYESLPWVRIKSSEEGVGPSAVTSWTEPRKGES